MYILFSAILNSHLVAFKITAGLSACLDQRGRLLSDAPPLLAERERPRPAFKARLHTYDACGYNRPFETMHD